MGCRLHEFPYTIKSIVLDKDKKYPKVTFNNVDDVWDYYALLEEDLKKNSQGNSDVTLDMYHSLPFFACKNVFLDNKMQKMVDRFIYCKETGVSPYNGSYGEQPKVWTDYYFIIYNAMQARNKLKQKQHEKEQEKKAKKKGN